MENLVTPKEHELIVMMFARMNERIGIIVETLKSRELWTGDDSKAFSDAIHSDDQKMDFYISNALRDYHGFAAQLGLVTGIKP